MKNLPRLTQTVTLRIVRNPYHAAAAIFVMFITFFVGGIFILITIGSNIILNYFESRPGVTAFLVDDTKKADIDNLIETLQKNEKIKDLNYISKEQALEIYKERNKNQPILLEFVSAEILPASIEVSAGDLKDLEGIAASLDKEPIVEEVIFQKNIVETLSAWTNLIRNIGIAVVGFLIVTSILITLLVIGLNISLHKDEIEIMKLVGATTWYVRLPFVLEGIFYGAFAAIAATLATWIAFLWIAPFLKRTFLDIPVVPSGPTVFLYILAAQLTAGILIGTIGALIATRKYLRV